MMGRAARSQGREGFKLEDYQGGEDAEANRRGPKRCYVGTIE
jgi:hypothetical protein